MESVSNSCLLGAPLSEGPAMDGILEAKCRDLERALTRMHLLSSQDDLLIAVCFMWWGPHIVLTTRLWMSSTCFYAKDSLASLTVTSVSQRGCRLAFRLALVAMEFVACRCLPRPHFLLRLQPRAISRTPFLATYDPLLATDEAVLRCEEAWADLADANPPPADQAARQKSWDNKVVQECRTRLELSAKDKVDRARLMAVFAPHAGD